jgi:preprotein translocase subunit YajC
MEFLLSHWHCIVPAAAILIGLFFINRSQQKRTNDEVNHEDPLQRASRKEHDHV